MRGKLGIEPEAIFRGASTPDLRSVFGVDTLQDIVNTDYKILVKTIARPLISGGHEKGKGIHEIINARKGGSCRTKHLKQMLFEIFSPGQEHPELNDRGRLVQNSNQKNWTPSKALHNISMRTTIQFEIAF